jgi:hypothetical protein
MVWFAPEGPVLVRLTARKNRPKATGEVMNLRVNDEVYDPAQRLS